MSEYQYFIWKRDEAEGPYSRAALEKMVIDGRLTPEDQVRADGFVKWVPITEIVDEYFIPTDAEWERVPSNAQAPASEVSKRWREATEHAKREVARKQFASPLQNASWGRVFAADLLDYVIAFAFVMLVVALPLTDRFISDNPVTEYVFKENGVFVGLVPLLMIAGIFAFYVFNIWFNVRRERSSFGKSLMGIVVVDEHGATLRALYASEHHMHSWNYEGSMIKKTQRAKKRGKPERSETWRVVTIASLQAHRASVEQPDAAQQQTQKRASERASA